MKTIFLKISKNITGFIFSNEFYKFYFHKSQKLDLYIFKNKEFKIKKKN